MSFLQDSAPQAVMIETRSFADCDLRGYGVAADHHGNQFEKTSGKSQFQRIELMCKIPKWIDHTSDKIRFVANVNNGTSLTVKKHGKLREFYCILDGTLFILRYIEKEESAAAGAKKFPPDCSCG